MPAHHRRGSAGGRQPPARSGRALWRRGVRDHPARYRRAGCRCHCRTFAVGDTTPGHRPRGVAPWHRDGEFRGCDGLCREGGAGREPAQPGRQAPVPGQGAGAGLCRCGAKNAGCLAGSFGGLRASRQAFVSSGAEGIGHATDLADWIDEQHIEPHPALPPFRVRAKQDFRRRH
jgi:hypothetical protein